MSTSSGVKSCVAVSLELNEERRRTHLDSGEVEEGEGKLYGMFMIVKELCGRCMWGRQQDVSDRLPGERNGASYTAGESLHLIIGG